MAEPKQQMLKVTERLSIPEQVTRNAIVPFLDAQSLFAFSWTCRHNRKQYKEKQADKKVASEMLLCVLNPTAPNQARFLELLSTPKQDLTPLYLIPNQGEEIYFNKGGTKKTKAKRGSTTVLEAILRTGNFHLAKTLFNCIPKEAKTDALKQQIRDIKAQGIWGMPALQTAYKNFIDSWQALWDVANWRELDRLSGLLGQAQKKHLPWFSLYLFCHHVTHANANYKLAPNWVCILGDHSELDLDLVGAGSIFALYKGAAPGAVARGVGVLRGRVGGLRALGGVLDADAAAFDSQCKVLSSEMDKTIKQFGLDALESDVTQKIGLR